MADINNIKEWLEEVLGIETYDGEINEFVDWVTGVDSFTNRSVSDGKNISGGSIRRLLQDRLQNPFIVYEDEENGLFRLFPSVTAKDRWVEGHDPNNPSYDGGEYTNKLELFNFERPSEFVLSTTLTNDTRYVIKGDSASSESRLSFNVYLKDKDNQTKNDSLVVTYTITNNVTQVTQTFSEPFSSQYVNNPDNPITIDLYNYLDNGINSVNVNIKATTLSNSIDIGFNMYFISFSLDSSFDFNKAKTYGQTITVPFEINRSAVVKGTVLYVSVYIDGRIALLETGGEATWDDGGSTSTRVNGEMKIKNTVENGVPTYAPSDSVNTHVFHTLRIEARMQSGHTVFNSNTLNYTFEISSLTTDFYNKFANIGISLSKEKTFFDQETGELILQAQQYVPFTMDWGYYTDNINKFQSISLTWAFKRQLHGGVEYTPIATVTAKKEGRYTLQFVPEFASNAENYRLVAMYENEEIDSWPIYIERSNLQVVEASGYNLKLSAYGRSNTEPSETRNVWSDPTHGVETTFVGVSWDNKSGWDDNSFFSIGEDSYALVQYVPFARNFGELGKTIEIEFQSEQVNDDNDILIEIGDENFGRIVVTPVKASVYVGSTEKVSTHYKANERIKLAFIFNKNNAAESSNLIYIINNGVIERAAGADSIQDYVSAIGHFKIGGSQSGVRVYMIRAYDIALTYSDAYNNFVYDSQNKGEIVSRNNIINSGEIIYDECVKKIDTVLIEGDMTKLLDMNETDKRKTETTVNIARFCVKDSTKSFTCVNGMIRKHGQSTLNYPITSLKFWLNKAATPDVNTVLSLSPIQEAMRLNKNRYIMKDGAVPSNKFVLQANYADSSGANNGALERLIQNTWYNANFGDDKNPVYRLRTAPQLFASGYVLTHDNANLGETGDKIWTDGTGEGEAVNKTWKDIATKPFPYILRNAPDSFPCAVFYKNTAPGADGTVKFLGQYVFMEDKKSDYIYGERSIYHYYDETDPFCLKIANKSEDKSENRVWNNNHVLRIEVVLLNNVLTSFMDFQVPKSATDPVNKGATVDCTAIKYDDKGNPEKFYWEDYFEMIYPDADDLAEGKFEPDSKFRQKASSFITLLRWLTDLSKNYNQGTKLPGKRVTQEVVNKFKETACEHLDLYKLAAYYIYFLRFGLVDSVERNAQLKTYDGQHWHYEPWDMDIAVGNKNTGGFVFDPPMDRETRQPDNQTIFAYSGRSLTTSNLLWDCLEEWDYWMDTVVPETARALYKAGLSYDSTVLMFDEEYSKKWSEVMYNFSEYFKYIEMRHNDNTWLLWLQGSCISHRHWWLSKSMNYYDAKWSCGDFETHRIYLNATKGEHSEGTDLVTIKPTSNTFFKMTRGDGTDTIGTLPATRENPAVFDVSRYVFEGKDPTHIYGATFIEELDVSCFAKRLGVFTLGAAYDEVLGAPIKVLNVGIPFSREVSETQYEGFVSGTELSIIANSDDGDALGNLRTLNITGQLKMASSNTILSAGNRRTVVNVYAMGSSISAFQSSSSGNSFGTLQLPAIALSGNTEKQRLSSITMTNSSWQNLSFWKTTITEPDQTGDEQEKFPEAQTAVFTKVNAPATMRGLYFYGSTASNICAANLLMEWIDSIVDYVHEQNPSVTVESEEFEELLISTLHTYNFIAENILWGTAENPVTIYYKDLRRIAAFNNGNNQANNLSGYIKIADTEELTPIQVAKLREWFGNSVFDKGNMNASLVVDQELGEEYIQINVGNDAYVGEIDGQPAIILEEGHSATLQATKFLLSDDDTIYDWAHFEDFAGAPVDIRLGDDGIYRLYVDEGTRGDYRIKVVATVRGGSVSKEVYVYIKSVTYPSDWIFRVEPKTNGATERKFKATANVMAKEFGANRIYQSGSNSVLRDCYVIYNSPQNFEFYVEAVNGVGTTATMKGITYGVTAIDTQGALPQTPSTDFIGDGNTFSLINNDEYLYTTNSATHNGIVLGCRGGVPAEFKRYIVTAQITIGGMVVTRYLNLMLVSDANILVRSGNNALYNTLASKLGGLQRDLYKTDLLSIDGTLAFEIHNINSLKTERVDDQVLSVFRYMPHLQELVMDDGVFEATDASITETDKRVLDFSNSRELTTISLTNASVTSVHVSELTVDVSGALALTTFTAVGTTLGICARFAQGAANALSAVSLGAPYEIIINNAGNWRSCTVSDQSNLTNVDVQNIMKDGSLYSFNAFNGIFHIEEPSPLPTGYTPVKYIASTKNGSQYIDLNLQMWNTAPISFALDMKCYMVGKGSDNQNMPTLFACIAEASPYPGFAIRNQSNSMITYVQTDYPDVQYGSNNTIVRVKLSKSDIDSVTHDWGTTLFCGLGDNRQPFRFSEARIYFCKIESQGQLVRDLLPCLNPDNVPGLYDLVNDVFYPSGSSTPFSYQV